MIIPLNLALRGSQHPPPSTPRRPAGRPLHRPLRGSPCGFQHRPPESPPRPPRKGPPRPPALVEEFPRQKISGGQSEAIKGHPPFFADLMFVKRPQCLLILDLACRPRPYQQSGEISEPGSLNQLQGKVQAGICCRKQAIFGHLSMRHEVLRLGHVPFTHASYRLNFVAHL